MARSVNDFVNRRNRPTLTHGARFRVALVPDESESPTGGILAKMAFGILTVSMVVRLVGVVMVCQMYQAIRGQSFHNMDDTDAIVDSLTQVTTSLAAATDWLVASNGLTIAGAVLGGVALMRYRYRARWIMLAFIPLAIVHLPFPLYGTLFGIACLGFLFWHRREFSPPILISPLSQDEAH